MSFYIFSATRISCVYKRVSPIYSFKTQFPKNWSTIRKLLANKTVNRSIIRHVYSGRSPFDDITNISKDVLLYSHEKSKFFKYLGVIGVIQLFFWTYWGTSLYEDLRDIKAVPEEQSELYSSKHPFWRRINLGEQKYRFIALMSCLSIGIGTLIITWTLPSRIVQNLILHKGGMGVTLTTHNTFGRVRNINIPISHLSCQNTREEAKAYLSLKIKGRWLYFLIDCQGKFYNPQLFDYTVGASSAKVW